MSTDYAEQKNKVHYDNCALQTNCCLKNLVILFDSSEVIILRAFANSKSLPWHKRFLAWALVGTIVFCPTALADAPKQPLKIGFIMVGPLNDWGWNYAHNQGRLFMQSNLNRQVETTAVENIPESSEVERVMEKMIRQGNKLIFSTSYGYLEPALRVAKRHPDVVIMEGGRANNIQPAANLGSYGTEFVNHCGPMYVAGIVAGMMTKKNSLGYVAAHPVPPVLSTLNAFTLGARSVNPKVKVHVVWTNSWSDAPLEAEASKALIDSGVDVLAAHLDSPTTVVQTAEKHGIYSVGYHADEHHLAPKGWLTGEKWNWGPLYVQIVKSVLDHTWKNSDQSTKESWQGYSDISSFGAAVPKNVQQNARDVLKKIETGQLQVFHGPLKDRDGKERLAAGKSADNKWFSEMNFVVPGVEGSLSKK